MKRWVKLVLAIYGMSVAEVSAAQKEELTP